ncbi:hypothetical protein PHET_03964 [Paragonimus heterotremus]|uniref:Uncharacterized protein n=1 Tax=Paragonimus heterotremus TaxID=100268 RepID=A0A8J4WJE6_9TREM|nr:hypothetical protein PHET_03964 [Paragonimus heterotremus]
MFLCSVPRTTLLTCLRFSSSAPIPRVDRPHCTSRSLFLIYHSISTTHLFVRIARLYKRYSVIRCSLSLSLHIYGTFTPLHSSSRQPSLFIFIILELYFSIQSHCTYSTHHCPTYSLYNIYIYIYIYIRVLCCIIVACIAV